MEKGAGVLGPLSKRTCGERGGGKITLRGF